MGLSAVVFDEYGVQPTLRVVDEPAVPDDGVVIRVRATGVCRSDWLGLSAVMVGVALGEVVAVDVSPAALDRARALGAEVLVDPRETPETGEAVRAATGGGAQVSLDALGSPATDYPAMLALVADGTLRPERASSAR